MYYLVESGSFANCGRLDGEHELLTGCREPVKVRQQLCPMSSLGHLWTHHTSWDNSSVLRAPWGTCEHTTQVETTALSYELLGAPVNTPHKLKQQLCPTSSLGHLWTHHTSWDNSSVLRAPWGTCEHTTQVETTALSYELLGAPVNTPHKLKQQLCPTSFLGHLWTHHTSWNNSSVLRAPWGTCEHTTQVETTALSYELLGAPVNTPHKLRQQLCPTSSLGHLWTHHTSWNNSSVLRAPWGTCEHTTQVETTALSYELLGAPVNTPHKLKQQLCPTSSLGHLWTHHTSWDNSSVLRAPWGTCEHTTQVETTALSYELLGAPVNTPHKLKQQLCPTSSLGHLWTHHTSWDNSSVLRAPWGTCEHTTQVETTALSYELLGAPVNTPHKLKQQLCPTSSLGHLWTHHTSWNNSSVLRAPWGTCEHTTQVETTALSYELLGAPVNTPHKLKQQLCPTSSLGHLWTHHTSWDNSSVLRAPWGTCEHTTQVETTALSYELLGAPVNTPHKLKQQLCPTSSLGHLWTHHTSWNNSSVLRAPWGTCEHTTQVETTALSYELLGAPVNTPHKLRQQLCPTSSLGHLWTHHTSWDNSSVLRAPWGTCEHTTQVETTALSYELLGAPVNTPHKLRQQLCPTSSLGHLWTHHTSWNNSSVLRAPWGTCEHTTQVETTALSYELLGAPVNTPHKLKQQLCPTSSLGHLWTHHTSWNNSSVLRAPWGTCEHTTQVETTALSYELLGAPVNTPHKLRQQLCPTSFSGHLWTHHTSWDNSSVLRASWGTCEHITQVETTALSYELLGAPVNTPHKLRQQLCPTSSLGHLWTHHTSWDNSSVLGASWGTCEHTTQVETTALSYELLGAPVNTPHKLRQQLCPTSSLGHLWTHHTSWDNSSVLRASRGTCEHITQVETTALSYELLGAPVNTSHKLKQQLCPTSFLGHLWTHHTSWDNSSVLRAPWGTCEHTTQVETTALS